MQSLKNMTFGPKLLTNLRAKVATTDCRAPNAELPQRRPSRCSPPPLPGPASPGTSATPRTSPTPRVLTTTLRPNSAPRPRLRAPGPALAPRARLPHSGPASRPGRPASPGGGFAVRAPLSRPRSASRWRDGLRWRKWRQPRPEGRAGGLPQFWAAPESVRSSMALFLLLVLTVQAGSWAEMGAADQKLSSGIVARGSAATGWGREGREGTPPARNPPPRWGAASAFVLDSRICPWCPVASGPKGAATGKATQGFRSLQPSLRFLRPLPWLPKQQNTFS